jgi:hypothetical protein
MDYEERWDLRMSPARYLLDHRRGTHADLARRLVAPGLNKTHRRRMTLLRLCLVAFNVLCEQLGKNMVVVGGGVPLEAAAKEWIRECQADLTARLDGEALDLWLLCGSTSDAGEQETKTVASILKSCAPRYKRYGLLGAPQAIEVYPPFWKLTTVPARYLARLGGTKVHAEEARAAVKPFEDVIWQELMQVEAALRKAMSSEDASHDADDVFILALNRAHGAIGHDRYGDNRSPQNVSEITFWVAHLAPLTIR